jgi:putative membrane protein
MNDRLVLPLIALVSVLVVVAVAVLTLGGRQGAPPASPLPALNATLNATSAVLLAAGYLAIRRRRIAAHRACMLAAFTASVVFLVSYVLYHAQAGSRPFPGQGWVRPVYFTLLVSHIVLAALILPAVLVTLYRAWQGEFGRHAALARWTLPVWLYVSVTGVVVYWMLYHLVAAR